MEPRRLTMPAKLSSAQANLWASPRSARRRVSTGMPEPRFQGRKTLPAKAKSHLDSGSVIELARIQNELIHLLSRSGGGSFLRGWRCQMDPDGDLKVEFRTFCEAAVRIEFSSNVHLLFGGDKADGTLSLADLSPQKFEMIDRFRHWVQQTFGSPLEMYENCNPDWEEKPKLPRSEFLTVIKRFGFEGTDEEILEIYDCCDVGGGEGITSDEVLFLELDDAVREREMLKRKMKDVQDWRLQLTNGYLEECDTASKKPCNRKAQRAWQAPFYHKLPQVMNQRRLGQSMDAMRKQADAVKAFHNHITAAFGNKVRALRRALAEEENGYSFDLKKLSKFCSRSSLPIDSRVLFRALDRDGDGKVQLEEFCSSRGQALAQFKQWAATGVWIDEKDRRRTIACCASIWDHQEASRRRTSTQVNGKITGNSARKMTVGSFKDLLRALGAPQAADKDKRSLLVGSLDLQGCGFITRADLEWLDGWNAPVWLYSKPNRDAWEELKAIFAERYDGLLLKAWRECLDVDNSNRISWEEFVTACEEVNFYGDVGGAWCYLDDDLSGFISLREFDSATSQLLESFKEWSDTNFGSVALCFKALDQDRSGSVTFSELQRACTKLLWTGNVRVLFDALKGGKTDANTGKRSIELQEVQFLDSWQIRVDLKGDEEDEDDEPVSPGIRRTFSDRPLGRTPAGGEPSPGHRKLLFEDGSGSRKGAKRRPVGLRTQRSMGTDKRATLSLLSMTRDRSGAIQKPVLKELPSEHQSSRSSGSLRSEPGPQHQAETTDDAPSDEPVASAPSKLEEPPPLLPAVSDDVDGVARAPEVAAGRRQDVGGRPPAPLSLDVGVPVAGGAPALGTPPPLSGLGARTEGVRSAPQLRGLPGQRPGTAPLGGRWDHLNQLADELDPGGAALKERPASAKELQALKDVLLNHAYGPPSLSALPKRRVRRPGTAGRSGAAVAGGQVAAPPAPRRSRPQSAAAAMHREITRETADGAKVLVTTAQVFKRMIHVPVVGP